MSMSRHKTHLKNIAKMEKMGFKLIIPYQIQDSARTISKRELRLSNERGYLHMPDITNNDSMIYWILPGSAPYYPIIFRNTDTNQILKFKTWKYLGNYIHYNNI